MLAIYKTKSPRRFPVETMPDGRQLCDLSTAEGLREYKRRTQEMVTRQDELCAICGPDYVGQLVFDHALGRGHGGAHRDDRILDESGQWMNAALCNNCNGRKGSKRYAWIDELYLPIRFQKVEVS